MCVSSTVVRQDKSELRAPQRAPSSSLGSKKFLNPNSKSTCSSVHKPCYKTLSRNEQRARLRITSHRSTSSSSRFWSWHLSVLDVSDPSTTMTTSILCEPPLSTSKPTPAFYHLCTRCGTLAVRR